MTQRQKNTKSRRRFLADLLFLGGGVSAAALLVKSQLLDGAQAVVPPLGGGTEVEHPPELAGAVEVPTQRATPEPIQHPPMPGDPVQSVPEDTPHCPTPQVEGEVIPPSPPPPKLAGKPASPRLDPKRR